MEATARLIPDMPEDDYHADPWGSPSLSSSIARVLLRCPRAAHHEHPLLGGVQRSSTPRSAAMRLGTAVHACVLLGREIAIVDGQSKEATAERRARRAEGLPVLCSSEAELASGAIASALALLGEALPGPRIPEGVILWHDSTETGTTVRCRARLDACAPERGAILDLKTTPDASPRGFARSAVAYGYALQAAAYEAALTALAPDWAGRITYRILAVETRPPHVAAVYEFDGSFRELGRRQWRRALSTWAECLETGHWPGYPGGVLECPEWAMRDDMAAQLDGWVERQEAAVEAAGL